MSRFDFTDERIINIFRNPGCGRSSVGSSNKSRPQMNQSNKNYYKHLKLAQQQQQQQRYGKRGRKDDDELDDDHRCLRTEFPQLEMDRCTVVTDQNVYMIELR